MALLSGVPSVRKSDLEERFRLLDRCDRDLDEELDELKNILHFDPALAGIYWRLPIGTNKARPGTEAKLERALRYLLKRMSVKEDDPYLLLRAWVILRLVIAQLDAVRTEKLIREHKFIESLERTILRISDLFTKNLVGQTLRPAIAPRNTMNDGDTSDSKPARERPRRNLKRKRGEMELSQDRTLLYDLFIAVCSTVRQLQLTCDTLDEENELLMWRIKGVLGLASGEDAARTLGASLAIVHQMVQPDVFSEDFIDFQKDLMAPTLWLWNCYVERFGRVESSMDVAKSFGTFCLQSALQVWPLLNTNNCVESANELRNTVIGNFLQPMLDYYTEERKVATESGSDARKTMQEMVSNIALPNAPPTTITSSSSLPEAHSQKLDVLSSENETTYLPHDPISVLFLFAATRFAEKADVVSGWLQTLFKDLCRCAHLDVDAPEKSSSSRTYLPQIAALLKTAAMTSLPVDPQTLEAIILHFCNIDTKAYLLSDFEGLQVCLKYHSAVILKARKLQSPLLDSLLQKLTNLRQVFGMNNCNLFLGPIINAFVASKTPLDFVQLWRQQIKKSVGNPAMNEAYSLEYQESIWEEETLQSLTPALIQVLESRSQAASLLRELSDSLARVIHSEVLEIGEFLSIVVVLESSLKRSNSRSPPLPLLETIGTLYSIVREAVNLPAIPMVHRWRLWRVASIICKCWPEAQKINDIDTIHLSLMEQAGDVILSNLELNNSDRLETLRYTEALEAQQYLVAVTSMTKLDLTYIDSIIKSATTSMKGLSKNFITGSLTLSQLALAEEAYTKRNSIRSKENFVLALAIGLVTTSTLLSLINQSSIFDFANEIYSLALHSTTSVDALGPGNLALSTEKIHWSTLWSQLVKYPEFKLHVNTIIKPRDNVSTKELQSENLRHAMDTTLVLPVRSIRGRDRVLIVDNLLSYLSADKIEKGGPSQQYIELLVRLMHESPSAARVIVDNFSRLLKLAIKCDDNWDENAVTSGHRHFRWLGRSTAVYIKESLQAENRIQALDGLAEGFLEYMKAIPKSTGNPPIVLCALMTEIFIALRDEAIFTGHLRPHFKHSFFEWLLKCFALFEPLRSEVDWRIGPLLANLASFPDLVLGLSKRLNSKKRDKEDCNGVKMLKIWLSRVRDDDVEPNQAHPSLARDNTLHQSHRIMSMISRPSKIWPEASELAEFFVPEFTRDRIRSLTRDFISLSPDTKISYINELRKYADADISGPITALLCKVLLTPFQEINRTDKMRAGLGDALDWLLRTLADPTNEIKFSYLARTVTSFVEKNSWVVTQKHIESVLELISAVVGTKSHGFLGSATSIFSSLCELLGAILNVHRVRIEGRLSVITKQLSKLLECPFEPFANTQLTRPPWILNSETKLSVEAAKKYSRVLTTLCDPTVSAVRKGRKRNELNDQTKIAKLIAGNNLLILLRDYCSLKLRGKLCAEIEDAIRPGIYAIFDAMIDDVRRELSDSLTSAEKDIFNDLYGDYRKFGKWEGN